MSSAKFGNVENLRGTERPYRFASELVGCGEHGEAAACSPSAATSRLAHLPRACRSRAVLHAALHVVHFRRRCSLMSLCVLSLCVVEEKEEVCLSLRLCACLWRRGCACFYGEGGGCLGVLEDARGGVQSRSSNAVCRFISEYGALRRRAFSVAAGCLLILQCELVWNQLPSS